MTLSRWFLNAFFRGEFNNFAHFMIGFSTVFMFNLWFQLFWALILSISVTILKELFDIIYAYFKDLKIDIPDTISDLLFGSLGTIFSGTLILFTTYFYFFF
jgi:hypothetical protein